MTLDPATDERLARDLVARGTEALQNALPHEAVRLFRQALVECPQNLELTRRLAFAHRAAGDHREADAAIVRLRSWLADASARGEATPSRVEVDRFRLGQRRVRVFHVLRSEDGAPNADVRWAFVVQGIDGGPGLVLRVFVAGEGQLHLVATSEEGRHLRVAEWTFEPSYVDLRSRVGAFVDRLEGSTSQS